MRRAKHVLPGLVVCLLNLSSASDKQRFEGRWVTTVSCEPARGALGFSYQFTSTVNDGVIHGLHGTEGQPGSLQIDGTIPPDGNAALYAKGRTGSKEFVPDAILRRAQSTATTSRRTSTIRPAAVRG
jgi:hypothetical protein